MATFTKSQFAALPAEVRENLKNDSNTVIVEDPAPETAASQAIFNKGSQTTAELEGDLLDDESTADDEDDSGLFINVYVVKGDKKFRLTFQSLDSDFVKFTDKEHTKENKVRNAIVQTVETHGMDKAAAGIKFEVELTQAGHSAELGDLLG